MDKYTVNDAIEAFCERYNFDDYDKMHFDDERLIEKVNEHIEDYEGFMPDNDDMAETVLEILDFLEYGDTSDANDLERIREDKFERFPYGRIY